MVGNRNYACASIDYVDTHTNIHVDIYIYVCISTNKYLLNPA